MDKRKRIRWREYSTKFATASKTAPGELEQAVSGSVVEGAGVRVAA